MGGILGRPKGDMGSAIAAGVEQQEELQRQKAERQEKARQLMMQRLQILRRRGGTVGGAGMQQPDQQDLIGG